MNLNISGSQLIIIFNFKSQSCDIINMKYSKYKFNVSRQFRFLDFCKDFLIRNMICNWNQEKNSFNDFFIL